MMQVKQGEQLPGGRLMSQQQLDEQHIASRNSKRRPAGEQYDDLIGAIDQGTSSTRFLVFERGTGRLVASSQLEIKRITPREGWVEIDPNSIMSSVYATMANVHDQLLAKQHQLNLSPADQQPRPCDSSLMGGQMLLKCIGICNQRESAVVWDAKTGQPLYNVIVWMDNRTKDIVDDMINSIPGRDFNHLKDKTGLPISTYFSAFKLRWLIDNVHEVREALAEGRLLVGTVDSWILWNLTGKHLTDVTNASRTFLMDIETLQWDKELCKRFKVPMEILPKILSSADDYGALKFGPFMGTPVTGVIGDQSAALFGHNCLQLGQTKSTFGTGCFIMQNTGPGPLNGALSGVQREAKRGLITTVGYKLKDKPACYALEGSIKIAGAALTWLRDNMQLISNYEECDQLVNTTTNSAGVFFVPALGGLYSPYWDPNAAGLFIGLSQFTRREHLVRATFDSIAFQTNDILSLMRGVTNGLMIDGGLCKSDNLCQILADITGCDIVRPSMCETSALGAAMVAGCGAGIWDYNSMMAHSNPPHDYACSSHRNHHYPHESLNYDENKFTHSLHHHSERVAKTFKSSSSLSSSGPQAGQSVSPAKKAGPQEIQGQQQQPTKHHRRSLRHRNGGRLMSNLDAGGGINDDAGGGGGGGGGETSGGLAGAQLPSAKQPRTYSSDEDENDTSSGGHLASSENEFDMGLLPLSSGSSSGDAAAGAAFASASATSASPAVIKSRPIESIHARQPGAASGGQGVKSRTLTASLINSLNLHHGAPPSSSGYSSGDNFESASNSCQLTESMRLLSEGRTDSPVSQATTGGRDSAAACTEDLSSKRHLVEDIKTIGRSGDVPPAFPFNLTNYIGQRRYDSVADSCGQQLVGDLQPCRTASPANLNDSDRTITSTAAPVVQEVTNRKFVEKAEHVADEVHEFGGRDSYGEDGYDSSTISFDSYDDDGQIDGLHDQLIEQHVAEVVYYGDDNGDPEDEHQANGNASAAPLTTTHHDVISNKSSGVSGENNQGLAHHHHHRRRQASLLEKQMDIFQPYISLEHRTELVDTWRLAVTRSMQWTKVHHEEIRRIDYQRLSSLPISMYVFFSLGLVALSSCISPESLLSQ